MGRLVHKEAFLEATLRKYETLYLLRPNLTEDAQKRLRTRISEAIKTNGGKVLRETDWGVRKTAYPIKKQAKAHIVELLYAGQPGLVGEIERLLRIMDDIIKYHSVKAGDLVTAEELAKETEFQVKAREESDRPQGRRRGDGDRDRDRGRGRDRFDDDDEEEEEEDEE